MFLRNLKKTVTSSLEPPQLNKADITLYILLGEIQWLGWIQAFGSGGQAIAVVQTPRCTVCMCTLYLWNIYNFASPKFSNNTFTYFKLLFPRNTHTWTLWESFVVRFGLKGLQCEPRHLKPLLAEPPHSWIWKGHGGTMALGKNQPSPYHTFHTRPCRNVRV